jgi:hemerythrin
MAYFEWKQEYSVGVAKLDDEHKELVRLLNSLYEAFKQGKGRDALGLIIAKLIKYTQTHFSSEESIMMLNGYPGLELHRDKHRKMAAKVQRIHQKFQRGEIRNPIEISNFLKDWLQKHIQGTDKLYGPYLNKKGIH